MRDIQYDAGRRQAERVKDRVERVSAEIIDPFERRWSRKQAQMISTFRKQAIDEGAIGPVGLKHPAGNPLPRILVVVEAGGAKSEIEVDDDRIQLEIACDRPGDVVRDR